MTQPITSHSAFPWGKVELDQETGHVLTVLPLVSHCLDVAFVFRTIVGLPTVRKRLEVAAIMPLGEAQLDRLAVIAAIHDVGKINLGFQDKVFNPKAPKAGHVRELAPCLFEQDLAAAFASAIELPILASWFHPEEALEGFLIAAWSHHGRPATFDPAQRTGNYFPAKTQWWRSDEGREPMTEVARLLENSRSAFPAAFAPDVPPLSGHPAFQHRFAGFVMLADWLGSHQHYFPIARPHDNTAVFSWSAARRAVAAVGMEQRLAQSGLVNSHRSFSDYFGFDPRPLQAALSDLPVEPAPHHLLIAEAETGSGKTEAALARFFSLFAAGEVDSLYFALPTRVAAREIYKRVVNLMKRAFPSEDTRPSSVLAVPGYARVDNNFISKALPSEDVRWMDEMSDLHKARSWAAEHPKRFLAATVAVGTIDQALLSTVQTPHCHMRSVCLDRSLLVVDEVHASDTYMRRLLSALIKHHIGLGGHAILLSATLGAAARAEFISAAGKKVAAPAFEESCAAPYPSLTDCAGPLPIVPSKEGMPEKRVSFELKLVAGEGPPAIPEIATALCAGARVLIVLNTVSRAIAMQRLLESSANIPAGSFFQCREVQCPHHGRFAPADRELLDAAVSDRFGKGSSPGPVVIVGTQTLEQSLDIDADLIITDLCPADVLLQRVGRLHRHLRERPIEFENARCIVLVPACANLAEFLDAKGAVHPEGKKAGLGSVYEDLRTAELTRQFLSQNQQVRIPMDNRKFVEWATHSQQIESLNGERWLKHGQIVEGTALAQSLAASSAVMDYNSPFGESAFQELNERARTRLGLDTLRIRLDRAVMSPFGEGIDEIVIPGHMAPKVVPDEPVRVLEHDFNITYLKFGGTCYSYSRFGLEKADESAH